MTHGTPGALNSPSSANHMSRLPTARSVAWVVLQRVERHEVFADEALDRCLSQARLDRRDRALAVELVYGVLRHRSTLDWRLAHLSERPFERLPLPVRTALRLGAYQLMFLQRVPVSAAVNESVSLVKRLPAKHWTGFVNAVLRAFLREPAPDWPDPASDPPLAYAVRYGCPPWLAQRWLDRFGAKQAESLCEATTVIPPLTIRANTLKMSRERLLEEFLKAQCTARPTEISPAGLIVEQRGPVAELPFFQQGGFYVEDEAGQLVAPILDPRPGERVLDACAAPGGKATHLAALMQNEGEIIALDRHPARLHLLQENCARLGISIVRAMQADAARDLPGLPGVRSASWSSSNAAALSFDRVMLDAPCSGLGVLRRHPEGKWQKTEQVLARHASEQSLLLDRLSHVLRPGGVLVYSTCSTEAEENEQVIGHFLHQHPEFFRESVAPWLPPSGRTLVNAEGDFSTLFARRSMDGFFAARLRKAS
ncbi:MAG: 16S rRNA (cytosine(967)-C(5))-methyltransferase RsmB [Nitrospiraceae bacterium]